jgi:peptide chain release factor 1
MIMANIEEANEIISDNSDADMTEMAKMQLDEAKERLPELEEEIKFMLILKIQDAKNVMVEIRAGTGGDEASIFWEIYLECTLNTVRTVVGELQLSI